METKYIIQHVAENKASKINIGLSSNCCGQTVIRLYKTFAYLVLGGMEPPLGAGQPEEQHGCRADKRIEEHLLTTDFVLDKTLPLDVPVWIVSLDLSKE